MIKTLKIVIYRFSEVCDLATICMMLKGETFPRVLTFLITEEREREISSEK